MQCFVKSFVCIYVIAYRILAMPKTFRYFLIGLFSVFLIYTYYNILQVGSYCNTVKYDFKMTSDELIYRIKMLKGNNAEYDVWQTGQNGKRSNIDGTSLHYYTFYFNITVDVRRAIVMTLVNPRHNFPAKLEFNGITYSPNLGSWKDMGELKGTERKLVEGAFKEQVVDRIRSNR